MAETQAPPRSSLTDILLEQAGLSLERLPMLQVIFDRVATQCSEALRQLSTTPAYLTLDEVATGRIGDILDEYGAGLTAVYHCRELDAQVLIGLDRDFLYTLIEAMFGGDGTEPPCTGDRPLSTIETRVAQLMCEHAASALQAAFAPVAPATFKFERVETRMDFAVIGRRNNHAVVARVLIHALERTARLFIVIPQAALNPIRQNLARDVAAEVSQRDPRWVKQLESEVGRTAVSLRAVIDEPGLTLGDVAALKVGAVLKLRATPRSPIKLEAQDQSLFLCQLGQADGFYTVRVESRIDQKQELLDGLAGR
jgi:flagellar motor switch protein FliM